VAGILAVEQLGVQKKGRVLLADINFTVRQGTWCALVGPNGAGKTTLLKAILGLIPHTGRVHSGANLGYVPQRLTQNEVFPLTVLELVASGAKGWGFWWPGRLRQRVMVLLSQLGAEHLIDRPVQQLSGGQLQRILIARALMGEQRVLLLDEPTTGLDSAGIAELYDLLDQLRREQGLTLVVVSHDLPWVNQWADQVVCLNQTLLFQGVPRHVLTAQNLELAYGQPHG
jgi:zinc transport system ATP-binding protein